MDFVQGYYMFLLGLQLFLTGFFHGKPVHYEEYHAGRSALGAVMVLPIIGRIFNWW
jgi:hypothetical protein